MQSVSPFLMRFPCFGHGTCSFEMMKAKALANERDGLTNKGRLVNLNSERIPPVSSETGREAVPSGAASAFLSPISS